MPPKAFTLLGLFFLGLLNACSAPVVEPPAKQAKWFSCSGNLDCTILVDDACRVVPINRRYALDYLEWSRIQNGTIDERRTCREVRSQRVAGCHQGTCGEGIRFNK